MLNLDSAEEVKKLDTGEIIASIESFPKQISQAWQEASTVVFPEDYKAADNIVIAGMGGSTLGADILRSLFKDSLTVPLQIINHYELPNSVDDNTLVILASYSGTTEEVLAASEDARNRKAKIAGVTLGEGLGDFLEQNNLPGYFFKPDFNPSGQPRLGLGYTFTAMIAFLNKLGFISVDSAKVQAAVEELGRFNEMLVPEVSASGNKAKQLALELKGKIVVIVASEFLSGNAHVFANQTNENSKNFASYFLLSELNHHLLEGTTNPPCMKTDVKFIFLESDLYSEKIVKRLAITKEVLEKQELGFTSFKLTASDKLTQVIEGIVFSSWVTFYLGCLNGEDSARIPWVDYFKERLKNS